MEKGAEQPARSEDKRAAELENLRKMNLAKTMQVQLDGRGQPITKEEWYRQQKEQTQLTKQQQMDAAANLHNFRNGNISSTNGVKQQLKKKEMEAAEMLHSYRGKPEAILSHQVKKISTPQKFAGGREEYQNVSPSRTAGIDVSQVRPKFDSNAPEVVAPKETGAITTKEAPPLEPEDSGFDDFFSSLDEQFLPSSEKTDETAQKDDEHKSADEDLTTDDTNAPYGGLGEIVTKPSDSSNESSNEGSSGSASWVVLNDQQKARAPSDDFTKIESFAESKNDEDCAESLPQSMKNPTVVSPPAQDCNPPESEWIVRNIPVSFSLLTDSRDAPPEGSEGNDRLLKIIDGLINAAASSIEKNLQNENVKFLGNSCNFSVSKDGEFQT